MTECDATTDFAESGIVCHEGRPTSCSEVPPGTHCLFCEDFYDDPCGPNAFCFVDSHFDDPRNDTCVPSLSVGEECDVGTALENDVCASGNCGLPASAAEGAPEVCLVASGAACTDDDCTYCAGSDPICFQVCNRPCDHLPDHACGRRDHPSITGFDYACLPPCAADRTCPEGLYCLRLVDEGRTTYHCGP